MLKISVDFKSFVQPGIKNEKDDFNISLVTGYQGSGKSFFTIYNTETNFRNRIIYTNIKSYWSDTHKVKYFTKLNELYSNHDIGCIFIIDELSKKFTKDSKIDREFYSWLQQSRKHRRYVFMITQEYIQVPQWLRGVANTVYTTHKVPLTSIMATSYGIPVLNNESFEWDLEEISIRYYKRTKKMSAHYDTNEIIDEL